MNRLLLYFLAGACFTLPFSFRISTIVLLVFSVLCISDSIYQKTYERKGKIFQLLTLPSLFFVMAALGFIFSPYKEEAGKLIVKYLPFLFVSLAYVFSSKSLKTEAHKYISLGTISGVTATLLYLFAKTISKFIKSGETDLFRLFSHEYTYNRFIESLDSHPTYFAVLIIVANYFIYNSKKLNNVLKYILLIFNLFGLIFVMSRIGLIASMIQFMSLFFFLKKKEKIIYLTILLGLLASALYLYKYQLRDFYVLQRLSLELAWDINPENSTSTINNREADDSRTARWNAITKTILEKPILGYGTGSEKDVLSDTYKENNLLISLERKYNTHNQFLFFWLENGILAVLVFILFFVVNVKKAFHKADMFSFLFLFTLFLVCIFENYLNRTMGVLAVSIYLTFMKPNRK